MQRVPFRKGLQVTVILLLLGTCIIPCIVGQAVLNCTKITSIRDSPPDEEWNRTYGIPSKYAACGNCVQVTPDGGYIVTGYAGYGYWYDVYVLKVDSQGNEVWNRTFGNQSVARYDVGTWVEVTSDNGYIVTGDNCRIYSRGTTLSLPPGGNIPTNDRLGVRIPLSYGRFYAFDNTYPVQSVWFDPANPGALHTIGYSSADGYICAGVWASDVWYVCSYYGGLYTVDPATGAMTLIGGSTQLSGLGFVDTSGLMYGCDSTNLYTVDTTSGATTLVGPMNNAGMMTDMATDSYGSAYGVDSLDNNLYSIDLSTGAATVIGSTGVSCSYAGLGYDKENDILYLSSFSSEGRLYTVDVATGHATLVGSFQNGDEVEGLAIPYSGTWYQYDNAVWLIKVDANGNEAWNKTFRFGQGLGQAKGSCVKQTKDGGYIVTGSDAGHLLLLKTDGSGAIVWYKTYEDDSVGASLALTTDGGYIVTGTAAPHRLLLMKTDGNGTMEWERTVDSSGGSQVQQTSDGGYVVVGTSSTDTWSTEILLFKTDANGTPQWNRTFGDSGWDEWDRGYSVLETVDGDFVVGGTQLGLQGYVNDKFWLIRTHPDGEIVWNHFYLPSLSAQCYYVQQTLDHGLIATGGINVASGPWCVLLKVSGGNRPPHASPIEGPHWGVLNEGYSFCINATDPDGDTMYCQWDWGEGQTSDWYGPYPSNETVCVTHAWSQNGTYNIRVKLKDVYGHESDWSDAHVFTVGQPRYALLFGRFTNSTTEDGFQIIEAVNLRMIFFRPVCSFHYLAGEKIPFLLKTSRVFTMQRFIIGLVDAVM